MLKEYRILVWVMGKTPLSKRHYFSARNLQVMARGASGLSGTENDAFRNAGGAFRVRETRCRPKKSKI